MPVTHRQQKLDAFKALLDQLVGVTVYRDRTAPVKVAPAINMLAGGYSLSDEETGIDRIAQTVALEIYVEAATDDALSDAVSDLDARIQAAVFADLTLGGQAIYVEFEGMQDDPEPSGEGQTPAISFQLDFTIHYLRPEGSPIAA